MTLQYISEMGEEEEEGGILGGREPLVENLMTRTQTRVGMVIKALPFRFVNELLLIRRL